MACTPMRRKPKFDAGIIRGINARRAAMERQ